MQQEVRFALVMYGGVSLAVYMNGVTQEFLHLVRATSTAAGEPNGTEAVYRELARIADARFVVDILSGSSAGGINAVFLGKALANGQSLEGLSRLWIEEADLACLWNASLRPRSLLSGQAIYSMLLHALESMDAAGGCGPLQREADLFLTTTDIQGLELPLDLADPRVTEKRHKNVFHFRFAHGDRNDFAHEHNPFLAFASRATSSFPLAFQPARLVDYPATGCASEFFPAYAAAGADYVHRAFGDGGYLNNKPFNYALAEIPRRVSDLPVRRLLMYIEPAPEQASGNAVERAPGPIRNSIEALITLHQYETIREDLQQVLERNTLVERVREATAQVDRDVERWRGRNCSERRVAPRLAGADYARRTLAQEVRDRGPGYAGYHRLKVQAVTGDLARMTGRPRAEVEAWRVANYREEDSASSENLFLLHFDLGYRQRRLRFLMAKLGQAGERGALRAELGRIALRLGDPTLAGLEWEAARQVLRAALIPAARDLERALEGHLLKSCFERYEDYDQVTFPVYYETQVGEAEPVEVFRVSPLDACSLIDETASGERRRKLAGTVLFHFGAFLKRSWRVNDLLWGRLDGAERIIHAVLGEGSADAARLVRQAQLTILRESYGEHAPAVLEQLRTSYEVDRRLGWGALLRNILRLLWISFKMLLAALIR